MSHPRILLPLIAIVALAGGWSARAGQNAWTLHGPLNNASVAGGGAVYSIATHPTNGSIALAGTPRGIFRTVDTGMNWTLVKDDLANVPVSIVFNPLNPDHVVATDGTLYLSTNGGQTFATLASPGGSAYVGMINFARDGTLYAFATGGHLFRAVAPFTSWTEITPGWTQGSPAFITIDPSDQQILYAGLYGQGIFRSTNAGGSWSPINYGLNNNNSQSYTALTVDPTNSARLVAAVGNDIYLSIDGGASWAPQYGHWATWVGFDPEDASVVYAIGYDGAIFRSYHGGENWTTIASLRLQSVSGMSFTAGSVGNLFVASSNGVIHNTGGLFSVEYRNKGLTGVSASQLVASHDTVYAAMSVGGHDFFRRHNSDYYPTGDGFSPPATTYRRFISSLAVAPGDSSQLFAINDFRELIRSIDGGAHWTGPDPAFQPGPGFATDLLNDVTIDPRDPQVAYVSRRQTGIWKTINGGSTFAQLMNSPAEVQLVGISPHNSAVLYAAVTGIGSNAMGIAKSIDAGATWVEQLAPSSTIGSRIFTSFVFHPTNPNLVYAPADHGGLYRTTDGGGSWNPVSLPQPGGVLWTVRGALIDPVMPSTVWVLGGEQTGFWRSVDNGISWETTSLPQVPGPAPYGGSVVFDPADPTRILASFSSAGIAEYHVQTDLALTMTLEPTTPFPTSSTVNASFRVSNLGPHASSSAELTIDVPAWMTPSAAGCTFAAPRLRCPFTALKVGQVRDVPVAFAVGATPQASGSIDVRLTGYEEDSYGLNNTTGFGAPAAEYADVDVSISAGTQTVERGSSTTVTVNVSNSGPSPSTATQLVLQLPTNMSASNVTTSGGSCTSGTGAINCSLGMLAVNASTSVTFALRADTAGNGTLLASVSGAGFDTDGANTAAREFTVRPEADLAVTLAESADPVTVGTGFQYIATVTNYGGDAGAFAVSIPITGASITDVTASLGSCSTSSSTVTCNSQGLAMGATGTVTINLGAVVPGIATATATAIPSGTDSNAANNSAIIGTTLRLVGDISVEIADSVDPATTSVPFTYTVTVRNAGPSAGAVNLTIPVTGGGISEATTSAGTCTPLLNPAKCTIPALPSGGSATVTLTVFASAPGTVGATASAEFVGVDPDVSDNSATAETVARAVADIGVTIADSADPVTAGGAFTYLVSLTTAGPSEGNVHLTVPVSAGAVNGATPSQGGVCTIAANTVTCDFAPIQFSPSTVTISMSPAAAGTLTATATATFSGTDPAAANNTATATTTVNAAPSSSGGGSSGGGGGGGGGRFDWLAAGLLGLLLARRKLSR